MVHRGHSSHCCVFAGSVYTERLPSIGSIRHNIILMKELEMMRMEAIVTKFKLLSQNYSGGTEYIHEKSRDSRPCRDSNRGVHKYKSEAILLETSCSATLLSNS
jgi:hypothetical protein